MLEKCIMDLRNVGCYWNRIQPFSEISYTRPRTYCVLPAHIDENIRESFRQHGQHVTIGIRAM